MGEIIDGKSISEGLRNEIAKDVAVLRKERDITPGLAVVLVGEDPASKIYVRNKAKLTTKVGMVSFEYKLPETIGETELLTLIAELNDNQEIHGILVQLPLPEHISTSKIIEAISPQKDVDGFHPVNAGKLATGQPGFAPCTPLGCVVLARHALGEMSGCEAVVVGRSNIVGKPLAQLLLNENCTVTIAHSRTRNLPEVTRRADLLVAAVGRPEMVKAAWIKPGATVIDVGINRIEAGQGSARLVGDVNFAEVSQVAGAITPVPGGVGPMTIACLLQNTLTAATNT
jgi:methylenetetrahydrofolate dehydrogenase (NADP+)/methenyltetrahydrofolate cyclohydrolase